MKRPLTAFPFSGLIFYPGAKATGLWKPPSLKGYIWNLDNRGKIINEKLRQYQKKSHKKN
jgi:hypothetical protein